MASDTHRPAVEVVALLASAGGLDALSIVLGDLPMDFPAAVVVQQHLGGNTSVLPTILGRRTRLRVGWARDGQMLTPGHVSVCPPGVNMELMPDGSCRLRRVEVPGERRCDVLLASIASSYGARGLAVVLSGSGRDGAEGTAAMKRAGALVIAQSPDTAAYPSMPIAAAQAGASPVLPTYEIGRVLIDMVEGAALLLPRGEVEVARALFDGPGEIRALLRETDWAATPLGPVMEWPAELRIMVRATVDSGCPMAVWWGPDEAHLIEAMADRSRDAVDPVRKPPEIQTVGVLFFRVDGAIVAVNDAFVRMSGYRHDELVGSGNLVDLAGEEFRRATSAVLRRLSETASVATYSDMVGAEESRWWALCSPMLPDSNAAAAGRGESVIEPTADARLNARLEEQFRALGRAVGETSRTTAVDDIVGDSPSWQGFTGLSVDEWIGWGWLNPGRPAAGEFAGSPWAAAVNAVTPLDTQIRLRPAAGGRCQLTRVTAIPLRRSGGTVRRGLGPDTRTGENATSQNSRRKTTAEGGPLMNTGDATANHHTDPAGMANHTGNAAAARAEAARLRADELRRRRQDLAAGRGATAQTVAIARRRAAESQRRAQQARRDAAEHAAALLRVDGRTYAYD
jgi:two-component system chemotaxis response regulator CheB